MDQTKAAPAKNGTGKNVYDIVTDKVIESLKQSKVPWRIPWTKAGVPTNLISGRPYRSINLMLLASLGYERNIFVTSKQLKQIGAYILPEERPHIVVHWNNIEKELVEGEKQEPANGKKKTPFLSYYTVYNIAQCAGIAEELIPPLAIAPDPIAACERIITLIPKYPTIKHRETNICYNPIEDVIYIPKQNKFPLAEQFYTVLFHQLVHSSGHRTRLDRMGLIQMHEVGYDSLSLEEMVAEIATCFLLSLAGLPIDFSQSGPQWIDWLSVLKLDSHIIFTAFSLAQKAIDFILNTPTAVEEKPEVE